VATGDPVPVDDLTTESQRVVAEPDGTFTASLSAAPVRERVDGRWVELDASLARLPDGLLSPAEAIGEVRLSGGGPVGSLLASYDVDGVGYGLRTPFALPRPTITDDTALYADVLPGVDLVSVAGTTGFTYNWVVKTPDAAADPRVRSLTLPADGDGVRPEPGSGGTSFVDGDGAAVLWTPTPTMWDSSGSVPEDRPVPDRPVESSIEAVEHGPSMADQVRDIGAVVTEDHVTLRPDLRLLDSPDAVFPIVIDPAIKYDKNRNGWTAVWNNFPTKSFWQTDHSLGAGYEGFEQNKIVRSYFRFATSGIAGKYVISAEMNVRQIHQASCTARPTDVYRTGAIGASTTWNKQPARSALQDTNTSTIGCGSGTGMVGWDVTNGARAYANAASATGTFMIRGRDEGDRIGWKQYDDAGANIEVTYVSKPDVPTSMQTKTGSSVIKCGTSTSPTIIGSTSVTISAVVSSDDKGSASLRGVFRRRDLAASADMADVAASTTVSSGGRSTISWSLSNGHTYRWNVKNRVYYSGGYLDSAFNSTWCYVKVDTSRPAAPTFPSSTFALCADEADPTSCPAVGTAHVAGTVRVDSASSDAIAYRWTLNGVTQTAVATSAGAARDLTFTPDRIMNDLEVWAYDGANESLHAFFTFKVNPKSPTLAWTFDGADPGANTGSASGGALLPGSGGIDENGRVDRAWRMDGTGTTAGAPAVTGTTVSTTTDFTVSAWVRTDAARSATFLSAPSGATNAFELGYDAATKTWTAGRRSGTATNVVAPPGGSPYQWTHLTATYDNATRLVTAYVNGTKFGSGALPSAAWANTGWVIGCSSVPGAVCLDGAVDEVSLWNVELSPEEITSLASPVSGADGRPVIAKVASWTMDDAGATSAADGVFGADLALSASPAAFLAPAHDGSGAGVLQLPGVSGQSARVAHPVADTTGSFTVSARVWLAPTTTPVVLAQQRGASGESWSMVYRPDSDGGGRFHFQRATADGGTSILDVRSSTTVDATDDWYVVTGVYDAQAKTIAIYVNGRRPEPGPDPAVDALPVRAFTTPWAAKGALDVGTGTLGGVVAPAGGEVDSVEVFAGAMDGTQALDYFDSLGI
jgi:hypothetical protein